MRASAITNPPSVSSADSSLERGSATIEKKGLTMIENKNEYKVYCLLFPNGKRYIGSTKLSMYNRIYKSKYEQQKKVQAAIDKFGIENIEVIILCEGLTHEGAHQIEQKFIDYYDVCNPEKGYNTLRVRKNENSEEARRKNRESSLKFFEQHPEMKDQIRKKHYCRPVKCLETGIEYPSASNCGKMMRISNGNILLACKGVIRHAGGYSFAFI